MSVQWGSQEMQRQTRLSVRPSTKESARIRTARNSSANASEANNQRARPWPGTRRDCSCSVPGCCANLRSRRGHADTSTSTGTGASTDPIRNNTRNLGPGCGSSSNSSEFQPRRRRHQIQAQGRPPQRDRARPPRRGAAEDTRATQCRRSTEPGASQPRPGGPGPRPRARRVHAREPARLVGRGAAVCGHEL